MDWSTNLKPKKWLTIPNNNDVFCRVGVDRRGTIVVDCADQELGQALAAVFEPVNTEGIPVLSGFRDQQSGELQVGLEVDRYAMPLDDDFLDRLRNFDLLFTSPKLRAYGIEIWRGEIGAG